MNVDMSADILLLLAGQLINMDDSGSGVCAYFFVYMVSRFYVSLGRLSSLFAFLGLILKSFLVPLGSS